jgi:phosphoribosyl 1,2-cyclic phosphate phosphodiesterase
MSGRITILGCGSSGGVPRVGAGWGACDPANPKNRRRRCSILVERGDGSEKTAIIVDTSPDFRDQCLSMDVGHLDAVLYSHDHADHVHGIDDVRPLVIQHRTIMPAYMDEATARGIRGRFDYCFASPPGSNYPPIMREHRLRFFEPVVIAGVGGPITALPFPLEHGDTMALGFRFGRVAYTPDLNAIPDESVAALADLDVWIVDALRRAPHPSHFHLNETLHWIEVIKPRRAILTNLHNDLDYETLCRELPAHVVPAYDGMTVAFEPD